MKKLLLFLLLLSLLSNAIAQNKFKGEWHTTKEDDGFDDMTDALQINDKTTSFSVVDNQLALTCKNVYKGDTLCLYVMSTDQGRGFMGPTFYPPKVGSLFAKCYIKGKTIHIIYTQKLFRNNIKRLELFTVMYKR